MNTTAKILITGGTGFVGHWMLQTQPHNVDCAWLDRRRYYELDWRVAEWDYIVHLAHVSPGPALRCIRNTGGRLLYCSSGIVYHPEKTDDTQYRLEKLEWEQRCLDEWPDTVIARLFAFYGEPNLGEHHAIVAFEKAARAGQPLHIFGDGFTVRSYMRGEDLGRWMWAILFNGASGEAYDVGSDEPVTMLQLARWVIDRTESDSEIIVQNGTDTMPHYLPLDTAKTRALL